MNIGKYSDKIYNVKNLKELKEILSEFSVKIAETLSNNSVLAKNVQETYVNTKSFGYRGKINNEDFYNYFCPSCQQMHKRSSTYSPYFCDTCNGNLSKQTHEEVVLLLDKNIIMYGDIGITHKDYDKLCVLEGDDVAYVEYMRNPSNFNYRIHSDFKLVVFTDKHQFRVYKNDSGALLQFNQKSGLSPRYSNQVLLDLFNSKDAFFNVVGDKIELDKSKSVFENINTIYYSQKTTTKKRKSNIPEEVISLIKKNNNDYDYGNNDFLYVNLDSKTNKVDMNIYTLDRRYNREDRIIKKRLTNKHNNCYATPLQSFEEIKQIIESSNYKYSGLDILLKKSLGSYNVISSTYDIREMLRFQDHYDENPNVEKVVKHPALSKFTNNGMSLEEYRDIIGDGKTINEVFGISSEAFTVFENIINYNSFWQLYTEEVKKHILNLKSYEKYVEDKSGYSIEYLDYLFFMVKYDELYTDKIIDMILNSGLKEKEIYNYLMRNYNKYKLSVKITLDYWYDYLTMGKELKYNFLNKSLLFPDDVLLSHDNASYAYDSLTKEYQEEIFKEKMDIARDNYSYNNERFSIIVPHKTSDIVEEGATLRHCVKSYIDNTVKGKTLILFIRKNEDLAKPYYTMEIKNNRVVQIRGFSNKTVEKLSDLDDFIKEFKENKEIY